MAGKIYVGDTGTEIIVDIGIDVTTLTSAKFLVTNPNGKQLLWTTSHTTGTILTYVTQAADFNLPGIWVIQAQIQIGAGKWSGKATQFEVFALGT